MNLPELMKVYKDEYHAGLAFALHYKEKVYSNHRESRAYGYIHCRSLSAVIYSLGIGSSSGFIGASNWRLGTYDIYVY